MTHGRRIAVIGLGYVGLPVAVAFAEAGTPVIGFDIDAGRIAELRSGRGSHARGRGASLRSAHLTFTAERDALKEPDFFIVTVPTPIDAARRPDMGAVLKASETVGRALKKGDIVVYESTVYPGATEEDCVPVLERVSGSSAGATSRSATRRSASTRATSSTASRRSSRSSRARTKRRWRRSLPSMARSSRRACTRLRRSRWPRPPR